MRNLIPRSAIAMLVVLAGSILAMPLAHAADRSGRFAIRGLGSQDCAAFLASTDKPDDYARFGSWLLGYVSARNRAELQTYDFIPTERGVDFPNIVAVVCRTRPQANLAAAAESALVAIAPLKQTSSSPLVEIRTPDGNVMIHQEALRKLQQALIDRRLYRGAADGRSNPPFIDALKDFQRSEKLPATGLPNIDTFIRAIIKR